ncbi:MAG: FISUMP domain-containing protein [Bacteroidales bacterium]|nr:FISUMP domain-containing protein [Bacteroidales bacterium]
MLSEGWHLPSDEEWKELELYLGIDTSDIDKTGDRGSVAGTLLKKGGGTGFNALYGGYHNSCVDDYGHMIWEAHFWTSTITHDYEPIVRIIAAGSGAVCRINSICHDRSSVRYTKDRNAALTGN